MANKTEDKRTMRTKAQLRNALLVLLRDKPLNKISVTELTQKAKINRGTFYLYYKDVFDMMQQIQNSMMDEFRAKYDDFLSGEISHSSFRNLLKFVFDFIAANNDLARIVLFSDHISAFVDIFVLYVKEQLLATKPSLLKQSPYVLPFLVQGIMGVINQWVENDMPHSSDVMVEHIAGFVNTNLANRIYEDFLE